jgi:hypothetical protein
MQLLLDKTTHLDVPAGDLVLLLDALHFRFGRQEWALYNSALKPVGENLAYFLKPTLRSGHESARLWRDVLAAIVPDVRGRIRALISDGFRGVGTICHENGWVHQRCHFHLLAQFMGPRRRMVRVRSRSRGVRDKVYRAVCVALRTTDDQELAQAVDLLNQLVALLPKRIGRWRGIVRRFLLELDDFRAYLRYPELHLPTTTSAIESMHSLMRTAVSRVNSPQAILRRAACLILLRPTISCNGPLHTQN